MISPEELSSMPYALESSAVYKIESACGRKVATVTSKRQLLSLNPPAREQAHSRSNHRVSRKEAQK